MHQYDEQIARIKQKFVAAKKKDRQHKVFGASSHKYIVNKPLEPADITRFEEKYHISLPGSFSAFLLQFGNGGESHADSAAGPFYGIFPLGKSTDELTSEPEKYLREPVKICPGISADTWTEMTKAFEDDDMTDEAFDAANGDLYAGILPLGSQGCTYLHGLILNGPHTGKVVNLDMDRQRPSFTFEDTFLDWYERWLDEIISGDLIRDTPSWFGYAMGGNAATLLEKYHAAPDDITKQHCLSGMLTKQNIADDIISGLEKEYQTANGQCQRLLLQILTRHNYPLAKPYLLAYCNVDLLAVFQFIFWYAKDKSIEWREVIEKNMAHITDGETFTFCTYLLTAAPADYGHLVSPMTKSENEAIRSTAFYTLGQLSHKADYIDDFINGLHDDATRVILSSLQALAGVTDERLLPAYKKLSERFPTEQDYILSNLGHRLKEFGLTINDLKSL